MADDLLSTRHPSYERWKSFWEFTRDHYDERLLYEEIQQSGDKVGEGSDYLIRKRQSEHDNEYAERKRLAHYTNYLAPILDSFVGMLFSQESEAERDWGGLGDPEDEGSLASTLDRDADRRETDWEAQNKQFATDLMVYQKVGVLVDTNRPATAEDIDQQTARRLGIRPFRRIIPPTAILNWREDAQGRIVEALVAESVDTRASLSDDASDAQTERFLHLGLGGWRRLVADEDGERVVGEGSYDFVDRNGEQTLPLFISRLPLRRYPAYDLARIVHAIFNLESAGIYWPIRRAGFARFIFSGRGWDEFEERVKKGANVVQENLSTEDGGKGHRYEGPPMDGPEMALQYKEELVRAIFQVAQFEFSDEAAERTATEINADFLSSTGAFLNVLAGAVDEAENASLHLLEQAAGVESPGDAMVSRSRDFSPESGRAVAQRIKEIVFGRGMGLPLPPEAVARVVTRILSSLDVVEEVDEELEDAILRSAQSEADRERILQESLAMGGSEPPA